VYHLHQPYIGKQASKFHERGKGHCVHQLDSVDLKVPRLPRDVVGVGSSSEQKSARGRRRPQRNLPDDVVFNYPWATWHCRNETKCSGTVVHGKRCLFD
jgi:hypothetical protein